MSRKRCHWFRRIFKRRADASNSPNLNNTPPPYTETQTTNPIEYTDSTTISVVVPRRLPWHQRRQQQQQPDVAEALRTFLARAGPNITTRDIEMAALGAELAAGGGVGGWQPIR